MTNKANNLSFEEVDSEYLLEDSDESDEFDIEENEKEKT